MTTRGAGAPPQLSVIEVTNIAGLVSEYTNPSGTGPTSVVYTPSPQIISQVGYRLQRKRFFLWKKAVPAYGNQESAGI